MSLNHRALNARRWAALRLAIFNRDGYRCRQCGKAGRLECHHVRPLESFPDQDPYDPDGLRALCRPCHFAATEAAQAEQQPAEVQAWRRLMKERMGVR